MVCEQNFLFCLFSIVVIKIQKIRIQLLASFLPSLWPLNDRVPQYKNIKQFNLFGPSLQQSEHWPSFWHSHRRAYSHTSVSKAKWLTEAWAQLPAGAPCLSQSLTTGTHMYIIFTRGLRQWQTHTYTCSLCISSPPWMACVISTSFPANIISF